MRLTPQQKLIAASAGAVLVLGVCAGGFWFIASGVGEDEAVRAGIQGRLDALAEDRGRAQASNALRAGRQEDRARILGFFVDRAHPIAFLQMLERLGRTTGATVAIDVDDGAGDEQHLGFRVIVEGGEQNAVRYMRLLEHSPYAIVVSDISEEKKSPDAASSSGSPDRLVVSLRVRTQ